MSPGGYIPLGSDGKAERQGDKMENEIVWNHSLEHELIGLKYTPFILKVKVNSLQKQIEQDMHCNVY